MIRGASGYSQIVDPDHPLVEWDTVNCCHCGTVIRTKPGTLSTIYLLFDPQRWVWCEEPGASCFHCMKPVCLACHDRGTCLPLERRLQAAEQHQNGKLLG